jgi:hypothetical protein
MTLKYIPYIYLTTVITICFISITVSAQVAKDLVDGNLIQFNDNGAWCWYPDEWAVVDTCTFDILSIPAFLDFTQIFSDNTVINSNAMRKL